MLHSLHLFKISLELCNHVCTLILQTGSFSPVKRCIIQQIRPHNADNGAQHTLHSWVHLHWLRVYVHVHPSDQVGPSWQCLRVCLYAIDVASKFAFKSVCL